MTKESVAGSVPRADPAALARALIACPSVTPTEAGVLAVLERVLVPAGFVVARPVFSTPGTADVENLFARIGSGSPHLAFAGHTDVVPSGEPAAWSHPPFAAEVADGVLYGRGAVDMKGAIAAFIAAALDFLAARGANLGGTLSLLITGDEEGPSINGTAKLLAWCAERGERFDAAIVGEPTSRERVGDTIKIGRRGTLSGEVTVTGVQGHSAYPEKAENPIPPLLAIAGALIDPPLDAGTDRFQPSNLELVSVDVGNEAWNVIPRAARVRFNIRFNDRWTVASLETEIRRRVADAARASRAREATVTFLRPSEAFVTAPGRLIETMTEAVAAETGIAPVRSTGGGTSDARFIKDCCPVIELGLVGATMHQVDERVPLADLARLTAIYRRFLDSFFAGA